MGFHRILCPVDFSDTSAEAARYAASLAGRHSAELTLLHVAPPIGLDYALIEPTQNRLREIASHRNQIARQAFESFPAEPALAVPAKRELVEGEAPEEIVRVARLGGHDLIVMSTHGSGAIRRWLLVGSVTTKVLHSSECAVLAATDFSARTAEIRNVVCAVDMGPESRRVLCGSVGLARELGARLTVVHAVPDYGGAADDLADREWRATLTMRVRAIVAELHDGEVVIDAGAPHAVVARVAERANADLVVIGRGVNTGLLGRLRANAYEIIRNSPCPVLSL